MSPRFYSCGRTVYATPEAQFCSTCDGRLARGEFAQDVPEVRYDRHGTNGEGCGGRYAGLLEHERNALLDAVDELILLRTAWGIRNDAANALEDEAWDVPTVIDSDAEATLLLSNETVAQCCDGLCDGTPATCEAWADAGG
jgi:hypothetical protein